MLDKRQIRPEAEAGVYVFGGIAITSIVTSCAGALVAMLTFIAQLHTPSAATIEKLTLAVIVLGVALLCSLTTALFAYLNQLAVVFGKERVWFRWTAVSLAVTAIFGLAIGGGLGIDAFHRSLVPSIRRLGAAYKGSTSESTKYGLPKAVSSKALDHPDFLISKSELLFIAEQNIIWRKQ